MLQKSDSCNLNSLVSGIIMSIQTRPDIRQPRSRAGGQGLYLRSLDHLGRSSEAKDRNNPKKVKCDGQIDERTDGRTDGQSGVKSRVARD